MSSPANRLRTWNIQKTRGSSGYVGTIKTRRGVYSACDAGPGGQGNSTLLHISKGWRKPWTWIPEGTIAENLMLGSAA